ncbi:hypothetical protein LCGC14_1521220 [marine sediment metagenome]|uniref:Uncharacterized protein n=1 Tax=marine sediment metagenome TaxID=412755 RepID=A0A0F9LZM3_9ZZZZ
MAKTPIPVVAMVTPLRIAQTLVNPQLRDSMALELRQRAREEGQYSKFQVGYLPITPFPPAAFFYECSTCTFYNLKAKSCELVQGVIEPFAWCGLWINLSEDKPLSWIKRAVAIK